MRKLLTIVCLCCLVNTAFAQADVIDIKIDTLKPTSWEAMNKMYHRPLFVMNGYPLSGSSDPKLTTLNPDSILYVNLLPRESLAGVIYGDDPADVIVIETRANAIKAYQKRFSAFSKKYKSYLEKHQNTDKDLTYVINGIQVEGKRDDIIKTLFNIEKKEIVDVSLIEQQRDHGNLTMVIIHKTD